MSNLGGIPRDAFHFRQELGYHFLHVLQEPLSLYGYKCDKLTQKMLNTKTDDDDYKFPK